MGGGGLWMWGILGDRLGRRWGVVRLAWLAVGGCGCPNGQRLGLVHPKLGEGRHDAQSLRTPREGRVGLPAYAIHDSPGVTDGGELRPPC